MAYQKQTWEDLPSQNTPITASRLNHIEDGIEEAWEHGGGGETLPIGSEIDFDGQSIPTGWEEIDDPNAYSTSEIKTDKTWVDGKPIYRQVFTGTKQASTNLIMQGLTSDFESLTDIRGTFIDGDGNKKLIPYYFSSGGTIIWLSAEIHFTGEIYVQGGNSPYSAGPFELIIEYTKTTDEGSGN